MNERVIHNGEILTPIPGIKDEEPQAPKAPQGKAAPPLLLQDIEPEELARLIAGTISSAMGESPQPTPMEIVNRLLCLKTECGHKVLWTRFDVSQLFAIWSNKLESQRNPRGRAGL